MLENWAFEKLTSWFFIFILFNQKVHTPVTEIANTIKQHHRISHNPKDNVGQKSLVTLVYEQQRHSGGMVAKLYLPGLWKVGGRLGNDLRDTVCHEPFAKKSTPTSRTKFYITCAGSIAKKRQHMFMRTILWIGLDCWWYHGSKTRCDVHLRTVCRWFFAVPAFSYCRNYVKAYANGWS